MPADYSFLPRRDFETQPGHVTHFDQSAAVFAFKLLTSITS